MPEIQGDKITLDVREGQLCSWSLAVVIATLGGQRDAAMSSIDGARQIVRVLGYDKVKALTEAFEKFGEDNGFILFNPETGDDEDGFVPEYN